jgi:hypothetical protein
MRLQAFPLCRCGAESTLAVIDTVFMMGAHRNGIAIETLRSKMVEIDTGAMVYKCFNLM